MKAIIHKEILNFEGNKVLLLLTDWGLCYHYQYYGKVTYTGYRSMFINKHNIVEDALDPIQYGRDSGKHLYDHLKELNRLKRYNLDYTREAYDKAFQKLFKGSMTAKKFNVLKYVTVKIITGNKTKHR